MAEIVRLYGLRIWIEQSYKQVKGALGWADYQVRADIAMRRHWELVCCVQSFCWWSLSHAPELVSELVADPTRQPGAVEANVPAQEESRAGEKKCTSRRISVSWPVALRRVRAYLEPYLILQRYWSGWSERPPPQPLQELLEWLRQGQPLYLYIR